MKRKIKQESYRQGKAHFAQTGEFLYYPLIDRDPSLPEAHLTVLVRHAERRLKEIGMADVVEAWKMTVGDVEGTYFVEWENKKHFKLVLSGILTADPPKPFKVIVDHGFSVEER